MKCILCGEELEAYGASARYVYCNADYCDLYDVALSVDAAKKLESIAQTSASNQWVSAQFQQWARNYIAEICEERDDARKWAKEYYKELNKQ